MNTKWSSILLTILNFIKCSLNRNKKMNRSTHYETISDSTYFGYEKVDDDIEFVTSDDDKCCSRSQNIERNRFLNLEKFVTSKDQLNSNNTQSQYLRPGLHTIFEENVLKIGSDKIQPREHQLVKKRPKSEADLIRSSAQDLIEENSDESTISDDFNLSDSTDGIIGEDILEKSSPYESSDCSSNEKT